MTTGTVKWFNGQKGFGFIQPEDGGTDVFVHISAVERAGLSGLAEGQKVNFEVKTDKMRGKTSAFDRADMHEHISSAVVRLDEPEALLAIEPLHSTCRHSSSPKRTRASRAIITRVNSTSTMSLEKEPAGAFNMAQRLIEQSST